MAGYRLRALLAEDAPCLLAFEITHKSFFEQSIEARPAQFYCPAAIDHHISEFMQLKQQGSAWPALIFTADEELIGRANLKEIDPLSQSAYVGYCIAEHWSGKGVASFAVHQLMQQARTMGLRLLLACVSTDNKASLRVLHKAGFKHMETIADVAVVQGRTTAGYLMWLKL